MLTPVSRAEPNVCDKFVAIAVCAMVIVTCIVTPLRMIACGYVPDTDVRRHAALAVSGKSLNDVLIVQNEPFVDPSPGWHTALRGLHLLLGWQKEKLITFSVIALFLLLNVCGLFWTRAEGWMLALALVASSSMSVAHRLTLGRPFLFTASVVIFLLFLWGNQADKPRFRLRAIVGLTIALIAASTWIHGSWYLFLLLVAALLFAGQFKKAAMFAGCFVLGCFVGACLTGHPMTFLSSPVSLTIGAFARGIPKSLLVSEFQEFREPLTPLLIIAGMLIWRTARSKDASQFARDPAFMLVLLCWLLGLNVARFWLDWGLPAMLVWCSREFNSALTPWLAGQPLRRLTMTLFACMAVFFLISNDVDERWSRVTASEPPAEAVRSFGDWFPGEGGIVYSAYMKTFYDLFYWYPHADWKYVLGFEPGLMRGEDLSTFINIRQAGHNSDTIRPWIQKMRPEDRLVVTASRRPELPELEWRYLHDTLWFGRLPRVPSTGRQ